MTTGPDQEKAAPTYDTDVGHLDEQTSIPLDQITQWRRSWKRVGSTIYYEAQGPCPKCGGPATGSARAATAPIEGVRDANVQRADDGPLLPEVEILVMCACQHSHGRAGQTGCGRWLTVTVLAVR